MGLFKADKAVPTLASPRIQRWVLLLAAYDCELIYREGHNHSKADGLSRLPIPDTITKVPVAGQRVLLMDQLEAMSMGVDHIADWTASNTVQQVLRRNFQHG